MERMDRNESANEGGSSPDTVIARSSEEEERKRQTCSTSGEYVTVGDSSSSLDTLTSGGGGGGGGFSGGLGASGGVASGLEGGSGRSSASGGAGGDASAGGTAGGSSSGARGAPTAPSPDSSLGSEEKKRGGRFEALKSSFRKEGGLFKMKKKSRAADTDNTHEPDQDPDEKEPARKKGHSEEEEAAAAAAVAEEERNRGGAEGAVSSAASVKKKKKRTKTQSLVRKFSLNKFRLTSAEQESRHTPEGGDSSRSQSQSPQDSPRLSESPTRIARKGQPSSQVQVQQPQHHQPHHQQQQKEAKERRKHRTCPESESEAEEREREKGEPRKSQKLLERPVSTITVVQRKSPSLTIRSYSRNVEHTLTDNTGHEEREAAEKSSRSEVKCSSTLPYAISKWASQQYEHPRNTNSDVGKKVKLSLRAESESESSRTSSGSTKSSPVEVRRKLSLLEEKRAIFQRRLFDTTRDSSDSHDTVIAVSVDDETKKAETSETSGDNNNARETIRKKARQISVRKFDTFSTFEGTFDEETGVGYLAGIEEDYTESYDRQNEEYPIHSSAMGPMGTGTATGESADRSKVLSQESTSSQNNAPSGGVVGEKREHLYKILVIGELGAGKTSIIKRYVHQFFSQHYRATIGVDFALKVLNWDPHTIIRLQLWDIAGQERFGNMTRVYYKEAVGAFIVFDVTRSATLDAVVKWKQDLDSKVQLPDGTAIPCVLLANKCDQQKEGLVNSPAKMDEYCREKNFAGWFETSAKENINIEEAARFLVNKILQNDQLMKGNGSQDQTDGERFALNQSPTSSKKGCSC